MTHQLTMAPGGVLVHVRPVVVEDADKITSAEGITTLLELAPAGDLLQLLVERLKLGCASSRALRLSDVAVRLDLPAVFERLAFDGEMLVNIPGPAFRTLPSFAQTCGTTAQRTL